MSYSRVVDPQVLRVLRTTKTKGTSSFLSPNMSKFFFADGVCKFRGVRDFLDYEALRENRRGCGKPIQVYTSELVMPEVFLFLFSKVHLTTGIVS